MDPLLRPFHNKILYCDIIGYSRLKPVDQLAAHQRLTNEIRHVLATILTVTVDEVIGLPTGDGAALNFIVGDPDIHLRAAVALLTQLGRDRPAFGLRLGLNSCVDSMVMDINAKRNIVGRGINYAQRVMDLGQPGQILLHDQVRRDLENYSAYASKLVYRGEYEVKHQVKIPVAQYVDAENPAINSALLPEPVAKRPKQVDLNAVLEEHTGKNLLTLTLDEQASIYLPEVRDYIGEYLEDCKEFQHLKIVVMWIASEMLENAFRHGPRNAVLKVGQTKSGVHVEVEHADVPGFDLGSTLGDASRELSFMRLVARRGCRWSQRRRGGLLALSLAIPRDLDLGSLHLSTRQPVDNSRHGLPEGVVQFMSGWSDKCRVDGALLIRMPAQDRAASIDDRLADTLVGCVEANSALIIDLGNLGYIGSNGLRAIWKAAQKARATSGARVALANPQKTVESILALSRFDFVVPVYLDVASAFYELLQASA